MGWRSLLISQFNDLVTDGGMDTVNTTLYTWLYEQAEFIGQMGNLSCPLPLPDPPTGDGVVQGGLVPAGGDQAVGGPAELCAAADQPLGDQSGGGPAELCAPADQPLGDQAVVGLADVDQAGAVVHDQAGLAGYDTWLLPSGQFRPLMPGVRESRGVGE